MAKIAPTNSSVDSSADSSKIFYAKLALSVVSCLSGIAFFFMLQSYKVSFGLSICFAGLWWFIIWTLDTFLITNTDKTLAIEYEIAITQDPSYEKTLMGVWVAIRSLFNLMNITRISISFCLAFFVSRPIELLLFRSAIEAKIRKAAMEDKQALDRERDKPLFVLRDRKKLLESRKDSLQNRKEKGISSTSTNDLFSACQKEISDLRLQVSEYKNQEQEVRRSSIEWQGGKKVISQDGLRELAKIRAEKKPIQEALYAKEQECRSDKQGFISFINGELDKTQADIKQLDNEINAINSINNRDKAQADADIDRQNVGFVVESRALADYTSENSSARRLELMIFALLMLIELLPLLIKIFSKPLQADIAEYQNRIQKIRLRNLQQREQIMLQNKATENKLAIQAQKLQEELRLEKLISDKMAAHDEEMTALKVQNEKEIAQERLLNTKLQAQADELAKRAKINKDILLAQEQANTNELEKVKLAYSFQLRKKIQDEEFEMDMMRSELERQLKELGINTDAKHRQTLYEAREFARILENKKEYYAAAQRRIEEDSLATYEKVTKKQNADMLNQAAKAQNEVAAHKLVEWKKKQGIP